MRQRRRRSQALAQESSRDLRRYWRKSYLATPAASSFPGREIYIKTIQAQTVVSASSNVVPLAGGAAATAILAATAGKWALLVSNGTNWEVMAGA